MRLSRHVALPVTLSGMLVLSACGGAEPADDRTARDAVDATDDERVGPTEDMGSTDDDAAQEPDPAASGGAECLQGAWDSDLAAAMEGALTIPGVAEYDPELTTSGESWVVFDGSTMTTEYREVVSEISMTIEGQTMISRTRHDGTQHATFTATDGELTIEEVDSSGLTLEISTVFGDEVMQLPIPDDLDAAAEGVGTVIPYTCDGDQLHLSVASDAMAGTGIDPSAFAQVLTRR